MGSALGALNGFIRRALRPLKLRGRRSSGARYSSVAPSRQFSDQDLRAFRAIRGVNSPPAIFVHGVTTRSGTVHLGEVLRLHPQIEAFPNDIWEFPLLGTIDDLLRAQTGFFNSYKQNRGKVDELLYLPLLGSAFVNYLYQSITPGRTLLMKVPDVAHLDYFEMVFPFERCVVLMRDGRDVVQSTISTWKERSLSEVARDWDTRARFLLQHKARHEGDQKFFYTTYETVQADTQALARSVFGHFGIDVSGYPFSTIAELPVRGSSSASVSEDKRVVWTPVEKPAGFKSTGRWKDNWSERQKREFKNIAGQSLIDWGYAEDLNW